jgi:hypothetical protein
MVHRRDNPASCIRGGIDLTRHRHESNLEQIDTEGWAMKHPRQSMQYHSARFAASNRKEEKKPFPLGLQIPASCQTKRRLTPRLGLFFSFTPRQFRGGQAVKCSIDLLQQAAHQAPHTA